MNRYNVKICIDIEEVTNRDGISNLTSYQKEINDIDLAPNDFSDMNRFLKVYVKDYILRNREELR